MNHMHHIIPRHWGGTDDPSNLYECSVEQHAELHFALYLEHGKWQDYIAAVTLSGQIDNDTARRQALIERNYTDNPMKNPDIAKKVAASCKAWWDDNPDAKQVVAERQRRFATGRKQTKEDRLKKSEAAKRRWADPDKRKKQAEAVKRSWQLRRLNNKNNE